jgi:hypothetical protein
MEKKKPLQVTKIEENEFFSHHTALSFVTCKPNVENEEMSFVLFVCVAIQNCSSHKYTLSGLRKIKETKWLIRTETKSSFLFYALNQHLTKHSISDTK